MLCITIVGCLVVWCLVVTNCVVGWVGFAVGLFGCLFVSLGWVGFLLSLIICYVILQCCLFWFG